MLVLVIVSCFALILSFYASRDEIPYGLELAFLLVASVAAIHYNYGSDYKEYYSLFERFIRYEHLESNLFFNKVYYKEPGWFLLNYAFKYLGFLPLVAFLSFFQNFVYYLFVRFYVPKSWWALGVFSYLFSNALYILNMSMMRQGLSISLFVLAWMVVQKERKLFPISILLVFVASTIHSSATILYPCLFILFCGKSISRYYGIVVMSLFLLFFVKPDLINSIFLNFNDVDEVNRLLLKYEDSAETLSYGLGFLLMMVPFVFMLLLLLFDSERLSDVEFRIIALAILAYNILPFRALIPMISRMSYYFTAFSIAAIPLVCQKMNRKYSIVFLASYVVLLLFDYYKFFTSPSYAESYQVFHSIFEVIF